MQLEGRIPQSSNISCAVLTYGSKLVKRVLFIPEYPRLTFGSKLLSSPSRNLQCRYTAVRPGISEFGNATEYGDPVGGEV